MVFQVDSDGEEVTLRVSDKGMGPSRDMTGVSFASIGSTELDARETGGTGLGLAVVATWWREPQEADSRSEGGLGRGTTFRASLPAALSRGKRASRSSSGAITGLTGRRSSTGTTRASLRRPPGTDPRCPSAASVQGREPGPRIALATCR